MEIFKKNSLLYLTVLAFAFATACLELYKQQHKKQIKNWKVLERSFKLQMMTHAPITH